MRTGQARHVWARLLLRVPRRAAALHHTGYLGLGAVAGPAAIVAAQRRPRRPRSASERRHDPRCGGGVHHRRLVCRHGALAGRRAEALEIHATRDEAVRRLLAEGARARRPGVDPHTTGGHRRRLVARHGVDVAPRPHQRGRRALPGRRRPRLPRARGGGDPRRALQGGPRSLREHAAADAGGARRGHEAVGASPELRTVGGGWWTGRRGGGARRRGEAFNIGRGCSGPWGPPAARAAQSVAGHGPLRSRRRGATTGRRRWEVAQSGRTALTGRRRPLRDQRSGFRQQTRGQ
mmetsp:Transcript_8924/g.25621  ORF Transcript_8924/g.25621 Transcript_8924/m.25621 type:complete len:292 (-) Transcript_8924:20-895(-)